MAKYVVFFRFKGETIKGLIDHPSDRAAVVRGLAEQVGGSMECYYLMFGQYDGFTVVDVPDSAAAAAISLAVSSSGTLAHVETHELIAADDLGGLLEKAGSLTYQAPGT
jgi:uncharacterized protein with GYD domain